jgi:hypothetical protein
MLGRYEGHIVRIREALWKHAEALWKHAYIHTCICILWHVVAYYARRDNRHARSASLNEDTIPALLRLHRR